MSRNFSGKYTKLRWSYIVGYIDSYDVVHSEIFSLLDGDNFTEIKTHIELFGLRLKNWRWDYDKGLEATIGYNDLNKEDFDRIREHLTDRYDIPFFLNGYHNVQFFCDKMDEEELIDENKN